MMTQQRAIQAKCIDCSGANAQEVKWCPVYQCPLWQYRLGRNKGRALKTAGKWVLDPSLHRKKLEAKCGSHSTHF